MVLPGAGSFGATKNQALFSGLEYLGVNEPSSSDLDITTNERFRRVPLSYKVSVPLMSVQNGNDFLALSWQPQENTAAFFDSPDRTFKSGGHAMGLLMPGAEKTMREDGNPLPYSGALLEANREYSQRATIFGGSGKNVVAAVREYVARRGLPSLPESGKDEAAYVDLATHGWLDSKIREGALVRHAFWPGFNPSAPADAMVYMEWLAARTKDAAQAARLRESANALHAKVDLNATLYSSVSHITPLFQPLVLGKVAENARHAANSARDNLKQFEAEGIRYAPPKDGTDYARGNGGSRFANGWTAGRVFNVLQAAAFSGDRELISQALDKLRVLDKYDGDVPRGAQTWEVPLHAPDILASANLVQAYALGYELTGDARMLERARYWAWTGVPFVYLTPPTAGKVGLYSTLAVYGATGWVGSWFGRPVQWNGLVYADALRHLALYDATGP